MLYYILLFVRWEPFDLYEKSKFIYIYWIPWLELASLSVLVEFVVRKWTEIII